MKSRLILVTRLLCLLISVLFFFFWIMGCRRYTSVGVDSDSRYGAYVVQHYYRARWIGDGSFWIGTGHFSFPYTSSYHMMPWDWGGRFFKQARLIAPRSPWNRLGFWRYRILPQPSPDPYLMPQESWIGVPGWLPAVLFALPLIWTAGRRRRAVRYNLKKTV